MFLLKAFKLMALCFRPTGGIGGVDWRGAILAGAVCLGLSAMPGTSLGFEAECLVKPKQTITLAGQMIGVVDEVNAERGDFVQAGDILATLKSDVERASLRLAEAQAEASGDLEAAEAEFEFERRRLERNLELYDQNVVSEGAIDGVRSSLRIAEARLSSARDRRVLANLSRVRAEALLASRVIRSPVAGVVVEVLRAPGEYADPPQILTVAQIDPLEIEAFLPSEMLAGIEVGLAGKVLIESDAGGTLESAVVSVDRIVDAASGTFGVRLEVANPELRPLAGLRCTLVFDMPMEAGAPEAPGFANTAP